MQRAIWALQAAGFIGLFMFIMWLTAGCGGSVVRDKGTYEAEVNFVEKANDEQVERGLALLKVACKCQNEPGSDMPFFTTVECENLAETILVVKYRSPYHVAFMRYLGGLTSKRPPVFPPVIPSSNVLCGELKGDL